MLDTAVGRELAGLVLGGALFAFVAVYKIVDEAISQACGKIGQTK